MNTSARSGLAISMSKASGPAVIMHECVVWAGQSVSIQSGPAVSAGARSGPAVSAGAQSGPAVSAGARSGPITDGCGPGNSGGPANSITKRPAARDHLREEPPPVLI